MFLDAWVHPLSKTAICYHMMSIKSLILIRHCYIHDLCLILKWHYFRIAFYVNCGGFVLKGLEIEEILNRNGHVRDKKNFDWSTRLFNYLLLLENQDYLFQ